MKQSLFKTLVNLKGNPKACIYTDILWAFSICLCLPYASVYRLAIGLNDVQIGLVTMIFTLSQVFFAFLSGPITDKLGRRKASFIFDFMAWCIPCLFWLFAQNIWYFIIAAVINGTVQVAANSWMCLFLEDIEKDQINNTNSLLLIVEQFSVFFAPVTVLLFSRLELVPAIRILYINGFVIMSLKVILCYAFSRETKMGKIKMEVTRGKSILKLAAGYSSVIKLIIKSRGTIYAIILTALAGIVVMVNTTFWQIIVSMKLLVPVHYLPVFLVLKSVITTLFLFFVLPCITGGSLKNPLLSGFVSFFAGQLILILTPAGSSALYIMLCISLVFDSFGYSILITLSRSLIAVNFDPEERSGIMAIMHIITLIITAPFAFFAGVLSDISRTLPFVLNLCLLAAGFCITAVHYKNREKPENRQLDKTELQCYVPHEQEIP